jgi:hypothetical protein
MKKTKSFHEKSYERALWGEMKKKLIEHHEKT